MPTNQISENSIESLFPVILDCVKLTINSMSLGLKKLKPFFFFMKESVEKKKEIEKNTYKLHLETTNSGSSMNEHLLNHGTMKTTKQSKGKTLHKHPRCL